MSARVRVEPKTSRLYLDLHIDGQRKKVTSHLPDTPRNRQILEAKAETIERELFLGTFDLERHFPTKKTKPVTFKELYEEWKKKKTNEVSPLTLEWYEEVGEGKILPFWGSKRLTDFSHSGFDTFKAGLLEQKLAPRTVNIVLLRLRELLRMAYQRGYLTEDRGNWVVKVFRARYLNDPRGTELLTRLRMMSKWQGRSPSQATRSDIATGRGIAYVKYELYRTYVGAVATVLRGGLRHRAPALGTDRPQVGGDRLGPQQDSRSRRLATWPANAA